MEDVQREIIFKNSNCFFSSFSARFSFLSFRWQVPFLYMRSGGSIRGGIVGEAEGSGGYGNRGDLPFRGL